MASNQLYTNCNVYIASKLLSEQTSVQVSRKTNATPVKTTAKGFGGMTPGSKEMEISVKSAVPSADFEMDPGSFMTDTKECQIILTRADGQTLTAEGYITEDNFQHATDSNAELDFKWIGPWAEWEI